MLVGRGDRRPTSPDNSYLHRSSGAHIRSLPERRYAPCMGGSVGGPIFLFGAYCPFSASFSYLGKRGVSVEF